MEKYKVIIRTGDFKDAGTDAGLKIVVEGSKNKITWDDFDDVNDSDDLERGDINEYDKKSAFLGIIPQDLGDIKQLTVTYSAKKNDSWYLCSVSIINTSTHKQWDFIANRWLTNKKPSITLTPSSVPIYTYYKVFIYTGEADNAGTDAKVHLNIVGNKNSYYLSDVNDPNDSDDFEAGDINQLIIASEKDLGDLKQITIGHNNKGGWYLDGVKIVNMKTNQEWNFPVYRWLSESDDDGKIERTVPVGKDMPHYKYINTYPKDREPGWSEELNGVCHDDDNWYFTQKGTIWKFPVKHDLNNTCKKENESEKIYKCVYEKDCHASVKSHLGDIDCYNGYLFVPVSDDGTPYIAVFSTNDIHTRVARHFMTLPDDKSSYSQSLGWLAINPKNGLLFTSDGSIGKKKPIYVYSIDFDAIRAGKNDFLTLYTRINLRNEEDDDYVERDWMQGGCFDDQNHLFLTNGAPTNGPTTSGIHNHANKKGGITVYEIPPLSKNPNGTVLVKVSARSNQCHAFRFQFDGYRNEPEGITYWDLDGKKAPGISGQLHAIMIDNNGSGDDDLYFKHFKKI
ncbi:PLAT/LH2 domain-containing protein [Fibrobacter sp. UWB12]|uniref:PLAT/LH2 domain-containing protein n=1 Tax=Fibrobacter sp. UWB12 TaxID=1896203 RepID=UPI0009125F68|nr:PLAT/LH2 domain-containing protein [Fibrobacter sp. UWB12]SHK61129.1 PLAT/LH2 domain-containing protein [Fibrobacter sp. UWB12]